jgi:dGTPase
MTSTILEQASRATHRDECVSREHEDLFARDLPPFVVDRRRIIQSASFRRLQHKTQVFVAGTGDHFRTRMTHTLEVAELARSIAQMLELNFELAEIVGLAHDLGHAPFGHAGERALAECMKDHGGFEHNAHSLRTVEYVEHPYPAFRGLNLTHIVRECLAKHSTQYDKPGAHALQDGRAAPPEGQVADLADRLAYGLHDLQDGLYADLFDPEMLDEVAIWRRCATGPTPTSRRQSRRHLRPVIDRIRQTLLDGVVSETRRRVAELGAKERASVEGDGVRVGGLVALPGELDGELRALERFLLEQVYRSPRLVRMDAKAKRVLTAVFDAYVGEPRLMPKRFAERVGAQGVHRVASDYIAGMTDRYCQDEHARLFDATVNG